MKPTFRILSVVIAAGLALAACDLQATPPPTAAPAPVPTQVPAASSPTAEIPATPTKEAASIPTVEPTSAPTANPATGVAVSFDALSLTLPTGVATGATGTLVDKVEGENAAPWDIAPAHIQLKLDGYALQDKFHQPQIYVYPAEAYAQMRPAAAQSLEALRAVLANNASAPVAAKDLPLVPFFNAAQPFAANVKVIPFQNGQGVRVVTQYAQGLVPVNNNELIYHFEGLTSDGKSYVIAILPITAPSLPEDGKPGATVPAGGVPLPDLNGANPDWPGYLGQVQQMLGGLQPGAFTPSLDQLDALIGSVSLAPAP